MTTVHHDARCTEDERRAALHRGDIFVHSQFPAALRLVELARGMIEGAFAPHDPRRVDQALSMEECAAVSAKLEPALIHHPACKALLPETIRGVAGDPERAHFDVPNVDSRSAGTTMRDDPRASDLDRLPDGITGLYDDGTAVEGRTTVFTPEMALAR